MMKFLVVGGGSMGKRRIRCLKANGVDAKQISFVDSQADRRQEVTQLHDVTGFADVEAGLNWDPDAVIVSVPGVHHLPVMRQAVAAGKHVFCEVPLSTTREHLDDLKAQAKNRSLVIAPGCQPLFDPLVRQLHEWINDPAFGPILSVREEMGEYLPDWHPYEDYRKFYASDIRMGGCNLDVVAQCLTTQFWLLDRCDATWLQINGEHLSTLEVKGVDYWQVFGKYDQGPVVNLQYDLFQRAGHYSVKYVSQGATALIDGGVARYYLASDKKWCEFTRPEGFQYEQCYIDEIACFLACLRGEQDWPNPIDRAIAVVGLIEDMTNRLVEEVAR